MGIKRRYTKVLGGKMSNNAPWFSNNKWGRSPRQDRRVIEDGKFVELGKVHEPPVVEEQVEVNTALEVVHEQPAVDSGASAARNVSNDSADGSGEVGFGSSEQQNEANRPTETGVV
jgi:hypothetical protein